MSRGTNSRWLHLNIAIEGNPCFSEMLVCEMAMSVFHVQHFLQDYGMNGTSNPNTNRESSITLGLLA